VAIDIQSFQDCFTAKKPQVGTLVIQLTILAMVELKISPAKSMVLAIC